MIPRISRGASAYGALGYDHGKARDPRSPHENPHKVAGNVPGRRWQDRARVIDQHMQTARPDASKPLHRTSLRVAETDRQLTDREWKQVAETYVREMGFDKCPWEATRHADDHIHITVSRVQWDGKLARSSHDYAKAQKACRQIEREHGLEDASRKFNRERPQISRNERESAQRRGEAVPEKDQLRERLQEAERRSDGTRAGYEKALTEQDVRYRANVAKTGRVSGYSYGLDGHRDREDKQVWVKGSQLGKAYSWNQTERRLAEQQRARGPAQTRQDEPTATRSGKPPQSQERQNTRGGEQQRAPLTRDQAREQARQEAAQRRAQREPGRGPAQTERSAAPQAVRPNQGRKPEGMSTSEQRRQPLTRDQAREQARQEAEQRRAREEAQRQRDQGRER